MTFWMPKLYKTSFVWAIFDFVEFDDNILIWYDDSWSQWILHYNWLSKYTTYIMEACPTIWQRIMYSGILSSVFIRKALFHSCWYDHLWGEEDVIFQNGFANFLRVFFFLACVQQGKWYTQHVCRNGYFLKLNRSHILV